MNKKNTTVTVKEKNNDKKDKIIIRVSSKENALIRKYAQAQNMNLSEYLRTRGTESLFNDQLKIEAAARMRAWEQVNEIYRLVAASGNKELLAQVKTRLMEMEGQRDD